MVCAVRTQHWRRENAKRPTKEKMWPPKGKGVPFVEQLGVGKWEAKKMPHHKWPLVKKRGRGMAIG
jgi:hypothetical protein